MTNRGREMWRDGGEERRDGIKKGGKKGLPTMPLHTCSCLSKINQLQIVRLMLLCRSDMVHLSKPEHHPGPLTNPAHIHTHTHTQTRNPPLPLEKRSSPTLDLLFKIQALAGKKKGWGGEKVIYDQILRKKVWFYRCHMTLAWVTSIFPNGAGPGF